MPALSFTIENPEMDFQIQETLRSNKLTKKFLCYKLKGELYNVLLIHNPEKVKLTSKVDYNTSKHGQLSCIATFNKKMGIFVDKKAPRALIKHISSFVELSWWKRYWNLYILNGTKLQHQFWEKKRFSNKITTYTYYPCSWYEAIINATP